MLAPADSPATATRTRSAPYITHTWPIAAMISPASPYARPKVVSNQFQQPLRFERRSCSG